MEERARKHEPYSTLVGTIIILVVAGFAGGGTAWYLNQTVNKSINSLQNQVDQLSQQVNEISKQVEGDGNGQ